MTTRMISHGGGRARIATAMILAAAGLSGCGDNAPAQPGDPDPEVCTDEVPEFVEPEGLLASPADLPADDCDPATLDGFDIQGLWAQTAIGQFSFGQVIEFARVCDVLTQLGGFDGAERFVSETEDGVFARQQVQFGQLTFVFAGTVCRRDPDGTLFGYQQTCRLDESGPLCGPAAPISMRPFGRIPGEPEADGLSLVSAWRGDPEAPWPDALETNVRVVAGVGYITRGDDGLRIVDLSQPESPLDLGHFPADEGDFFNDVKIVSGPGETTYALVASNQGVLSINVTDPASPTLDATFASLDQSPSIHTLFTEILDEATIAYVSDAVAPIVAVFDVTDPANPVELGLAPGPNGQGTHDLFADGGLLYLNGSFGGFSVVDTRAGLENPVELGQLVPEQLAYSHSNWVTEVGGRRIAVHGDEGIGAHIKIVDVDPESDEFMQAIGSFEVPNGASVHNIMAFGDLAYVAWYQNGVRVLDLSDPTSPRQVAHFNTWQPVSGEVEVFEGTLGIDVDLDAGLIYAADTQMGLVVLHIDE